MNAGDGKSREKSFNPRPSVRGDTDTAPARSKAGSFNPRPSVRGDVTLLHHRLHYNRFNPRPSVRGDMFVHIHIAQICSCQSTPLREGRRDAIDL